MIGSALIRRFEHEGAILLTATRDELDLTDGTAVEGWVADNQPDIIFLAAAKVGGIVANNDYPVEFLMENLQIEINVIKNAHKMGVSKLVFIASSCMYPRECAQPIKEEYLLSGPLEMTNDSFAIAKIAGIKMCQAYHDQYGCDFISVVPANSYGPQDSFCLDSGHVLASLMMKAYVAKKNNHSVLPLWGTGSAMREFIYVDDLADAIAFAACRYSSREPINIGSGQEVSIANLAEMIKAEVGFVGDLQYDISKPDGTPRKIVDRQKLSQLGWEPKIDLAQGIRLTYEWFLQQDFSTQ